GVAVGSTITAHVHVSADSAGLGNLTGLTFDGGTILSANPAVSVDLSGAPKAPAAFTLAPGQAKDYDVPVVLKATGKVVLTSAVSGFDVTSAAVHDSGSVTVAASGLQVVMTANPATAVQSDDPVTGKPDPVIVSVTAKVTNSTDHDLTGIKIDAKPTLARSDGKPATIPIPVEITGQASPSPTIGTLTPGQSSTVTYELKVNGAMKFDASVLAQGVDSISQVNTFGLGKVTVNVQPKFPLTLDATRSDSGEITAGMPWVITGIVTNQTEDKTYVISPLEPAVTDGATFRDERKLTESFPPLTPDPARCVPAVSVRLGPGEKYVFHARVLTVPTEPLSDPFSTAVAFGSGSVVAQEATQTESGEKLTPLDPDQVFFTKEVSPGTTQLHADVVAPPFDAGSDKEFFLNFGLGFYETSYIDYLAETLDGTIGMVGATLSGIDEFHQTFANMTPEERAAAASDTGHALTEYLGDTNGGVSAKLTTATADGLAQLDNWWKTTKASERGYTIGGESKKVIGDLTVGAITDAGVCRILSTTKYIEGVRLTESALAEDAALLSKGGLRVDKGLAGVPAAAVITPELMAARLGLTPAEYAAIQAAADKYGVTILVRSRASASSGLVEAQQAIVKPLAMKPKGLNDLDRILMRLNTGQVADASTIIASSLPESTEAEVLALG
ncbi:MAG TPA: hypothetical protein VGM93_10790, partial [Acidimicrobiales bacterium]